MENLKLVNKLLLPLVLLLITSCTGHNRFHSYLPIDRNGWKRTDTLCFHAIPTDTNESSLEISLGIRHTHRYPYRDIWLVIEKDTLHIELADEQGRWKGKGIGDMRLIQQETTISTTDMDSCGTIHIHHIMQHDPLPGISDIGIEVRE